MGGCLIDVLMIAVRSRRDLARAYLRTNGRGELREEWGERRTGHGILHGRTPTPRGEGREECQANLDVEGTRGLDLDGARDGLAMDYSTADHLLVRKKREQASCTRRRSPVQRGGVDKDV